MSSKKYFLVKVINRYHRMFGMVGHAKVTEEEFNEKKFEPKRSRVVVKFINGDSKSNFVPFRLDELKITTINNGGAMLLKYFPLADMGSTDTGDAPTIVWLNPMFVTQHLQGMQIRDVARHGGAQAPKNTGIGCPLCRETQCGELVSDKQATSIVDEIKLICNGCGAWYWGDFLPEKIV